VFDGDGVTCAVQGGGVSVDDTWIDGKVVAQPKLPTSVGGGATSKPSFFAATGGLIEVPSLSSLPGPAAAFVEAMRAADAAAGVSADGRSGGDAGADAGGDAAGDAAADVETHVRGRGRGGKTRGGASSRAVVDARLPVDAPPPPTAVAADDRDTRSFARASALPVRVPFSMRHVTMIRVKGADVLPHVCVGDTVRFRVAIPKVRCRVLLCCAALATMRCHHAPVTSSLVPSRAAGGGVAQGRSLQQRREHVGSARGAGGAAAAHRTATRWHRHLRRR
jgi:hypothetical protein